MDAEVKQRVKRVKFIADYVDHIRGVCPGCGLFIKKIEGQKFCQHCGQRIDWGLRNER